MGSWMEFIDQTWPPKPKLTEKELADQTGRVFIVTGATAGVGKALIEILYSRNATVYLVARSQERANKAVADIKRRVVNSSGDLVILEADFENLPSVKKAAEEFLSKETRLDVLFNNAAVLMPPADAKTMQGYDKQLGVNTLSPFLLTELLTPTLVKTAKISPRGSVRVVWVASSAVYLFSPPGGVEMSKIRDGTAKGQAYMYGVSKSGNVLHSIEFARRHQDDGIISTSCNPGNLKSELTREFSWWNRFLMRLISYEPIYGAYTELFCGLSPDILVEDSGAWLVPWGRIGALRPDIAQAARLKSEGGGGVAEEFWEWCTEQVREYL